MSVLIPDFKVFDYLNAGLIYTAHNKTVNDLYCGKVSSHLAHYDAFKESARLVRSWFSMNERSYNARYNETDSILKFYDVKQSGERPNCIQLIKYCQCLLYNIEVQTIQRIGEANENKSLFTAQDRKDYDLLEMFYEELKSAFIGSLPEYDNAKWCD
jgi:hypothetical protein